MVPKNVVLFQTLNFMKPFSALILSAILLIGCPILLQGQKVGLVLSGGGASGISHIGVIKALEEHNIPIDYITGTSMGALVGGLYASGYTVEEMIAMAKTPAFLLAVKGELPEEDVYYFSKDREDASIIRLKLSPSKLLSKSIPTNLVTPDLMEFMLMDIFSQPAAAAKYDFDHLMIPFRCVAADIARKEQVIFDHGSLSVALRASSTYPFYYKPLMVDSTLLFDGGLYNNFPADIMYTEFLPDVIIGSNVATTLDPPEEDDLLSQIRNMIISQSDFTLACEEGLIIEPPSTRGVFDFDDIDSEIELGYQSALARIDELKAFISREVDADERLANRQAFRSKFKAKHIGSMKITGTETKNQMLYIQKTAAKEVKDSLYTFADFRPHFLRVSQDDKIRSAQPITTYNENTGLFDMELKVRRERDLTAYFGGNFSSRPINMGFVGLKYNVFGRPSASIIANSYFGKFYSSLLISAKIDYGGKRRLMLEPHLILNQWDYFKSVATFFELSRPSFIVKDERFGGIGIGTSWGNNTVIRGDIRYGETEDRYYQTENFTPEDTADYTNFTLGTIGLAYDRNTLNYKKFANRGTRLEIALRGVYGDEITDYGTTRPEVDSIFEATHSWISFKVRYENYFLHLGKFTLGAEFEGLYSTQPFFQNYTASVIAAPAYQPIPESKTIFLQEFRTMMYGAVGLKAVFSIVNNLDFRLEGYGFQAGRSIMRNDQNQAVFSDPFQDRYFIGAAAFVFQSPLGPVSLNLNYYENRTDGPWSFLFNFGYTIFNRSVYQP